MKSSDDSIFGYDSAVLWSRTSGDLFTDDDDDEYVHRNRVSDSDETLSYSSWGFSNYEKRSVQKISSYLEAIDDALFEEKFSSLDPELTTECQKWRGVFPHLRLKGSKIPLEVVVNKSSDGFNLKVPTSQKITHPSFKRPCALKYAPAGCDSTDEDDYLPHEVFHQNEEVILKDGVFGESNFPISRIENGDPSVSSVKKPTFSHYYVKGKIIDYLADIVWKNVKYSCSNTSDAAEAKQSERLPPILSSGQSSELPRFQQTSASKRWSNLASDFPKLDGVLTVSPKVLLPKNERPGTRQTSISSRPDTGWSTSSASIKSASSQRSSARRLSRGSERNKHNPLLDCSSETKVTEKDLELIRMYLPTVEENNPLLPNGLQGLHIEPEMKRFTKLISLEVSSPPAKPPSFLPPIDDRDISAIQNKNFQNSLQEPHKRKDSNQNNCMIYARHLNKTGSRPGTSQTEDLNTSVLSRIKRPDSNLSSSGGKQSSKPSAISGGNNLVNIFPIVTSLEPKQLAKRKFTAQRKGMLSAIYQDKR